MFKTKTLVITARHDWGVEGTKKRVIERFETLKTNFLQLVAVTEMTWVDDVAHFRVRALGQTVTAVCDVKPKDLEIVIALPWLLGRFAGPLEKFIDSHGDVLKAKPKAGAPPPIMEPLPFHRRLFKSKRPRLDA